VGKGGAVFDLDKFAWMAGEYLRADTLERVADRCLPFMARAGLVSPADAGPGGPGRARYLALIGMIRERITLYSEAPARLAWAFADDAAVVYAEDAEKGARKQPGAAETLSAYLAWLRPRVERGIDAAALREATKAWALERGLKLGALFQPLRCALMGEAGGPDLFDAMALLGAESVLARIEAGAARLR
jgi:glutamyl/glutaminyl-tRNA synthetase